MRPALLALLAATAVIGASLAPAAAASSQRIPQRRQQRANSLQWIEDVEERRAILSRHLKRAFSRPAVAGPAESMPAGRARTDHRDGK